MRNPDFARVRRAFGLSAQHLGHGVYRVTGGEAPQQIVDLSDLDAPRCTCEDHRYRRQVCKHITAAALTRFPQAELARIAVDAGLLRPLN